jgi:anti-anti-sigma factor
VDVEDAERASDEGVPPPETKINVSVVEGCGVVAVSGEIDIATAGQLVALLAAEIDQRPDGVVVDLSGVAFMSSSGLGVLIESQETAQAVHTAFRLVVQSRRAPQAGARRCRPRGDVQHLRLC